MPAAVSGVFGKSDGGALRSSGLKPEQIQKMEISRMNIGLAQNAGAILISGNENLLEPITFSVGHLLWVGCYPPMRWADCMRILRTPCLTISGFLALVLSRLSAHFSRYTCAVAETSFWAELLQPKESLQAFKDQ